MNFAWTISYNLVFTSVPTRETFVINLDAIQLVELFLALSILVSEGWDKGDFETFHKNDNHSQMETHFAMT